MSLPDGDVDDGVLRRLRARLSRDGLNIVLPLSPAEFDRAVGALEGARLGDLLKGARGAVLVGDGGPAFFERFQASVSSRPADRSESRDPLDDYTTAVLEKAVGEALATPHQGVSARLFYPFVAARPALPFQRLGHAAGLPPPGPLGLQIHPVYGPWWAYRGLIAVSVALTADPAVQTSCSSCSSPCVGACPAGAVKTTGLLYSPCLAHRMSTLPCRDSCAARLACPVGAEHRYSEAQLAFHMKASMPTLRTIAS